MIQDRNFELMQRGGAGARWTSSTRSQAAEGRRARPTQQLRAGARAPAQGPVAHRLRRRRELDGLPRAAGGRAASSARPSTTPARANWPHASGTGRSRRSLSRPQLGTLPPRQSKLSRKPSHEPDPSRGGRVDRARPEMAALLQPVASLAAQPATPASSAAAEAVPAAAPDGFASLIHGGKVRAEFRYRFEYVDQDPFVDEAYASTLRTRLGLDSGAGTAFPRHSNSTTSRYWAMTTPTTRRRTA